MNTHLLEPYFFTKHPENLNIFGVQPFLKLRDNREPLKKPQAFGSAAFFMLFFEWARTRAAEPFDGDALQAERRHPSRRRVSDWKTCSQTEDSR